jgi:hypothetical protein
MARGSKSSYTSKQRRQARHIEESGEKRGMSKKRAASMAYATVNKQDGGGKKSGSGRGKSRSTASSRKGGKRSHSSTRGGSRAQHAKAGRASHK